MTVHHPITVDLVHRGVTPRVYAMQFDTNTRAIQLTMLSCGEAWTPPAGAEITLSYRKSDGTRGVYSHLSPEESAISVSGNTVTAVLAHQVLTAPGIVEAALVVCSGEGRLATFPFEIHVAPDPGAGEAASEDYFDPVDHLKKLAAWEVVCAQDAVTLHYTLEDGSAHTDSIAFDADGYPVSITHDGATAPGTWRDADA